MQHRPVNDNEEGKINESNEGQNKNNTSRKTEDNPQPPCWHHFNNTCRYGSRCKYSHNRADYIELRKKEKLNYEVYKKNKKPNLDIPNQEPEDYPQVIEEIVASKLQSNSKSDETPILIPPVELAPFTSTSLTEQPTQETGKSDVTPTLYQQKDSHRKICRYYKNNKCIYGDRCRDLHQKRQEYPTVTYYPKENHGEPKYPPQEVTEIYSNSSKPVNTDGLKSSKRYYLDRDEPGTRKLCWWHNSEKCIYGVNCWYVNKEDYQYSYRQPFLVEAQQA